MDAFQHYDAALSISELAGRRIPSSQTSPLRSPSLLSRSYPPDYHRDIEPEMLPCLLSAETADIGTELTDYPSHRSSDFDTQALFTTRNARSSSVSVMSSTSSEVDEDRPSQRLYQINIGVKAFWKLPVISEILWPFQWLSRRLKDIFSNSRFHGWRMGVLIGSFASSLVLCCNIGIMIFGVRNGYAEGFTVLSAGKKEDMSWRSSAIHVAINALSTLLLAASNYTMQVLSSPTREDIDRVHSAHNWLDIGILSVRNFGFIPIRRRILCVIMVLSSIPIHLFYNSAVFYIGAHNSYNVSILPVGSVEYDDLSHRATAANDNDRIVALDISGINSAYKGRPSLLEYGDLYLAIDGYVYQNESDLPKLGADGWSVSGAAALPWNPNVSWPLIIEEPVNFNWEVRNLDRKWACILVNSTIAVFSENDTQVYARCTRGFAKHHLKTSSRIELSLSFMAVVVVCNLVKLFTMLWVVFMENLDYIVTIGDGAASFLAYPDPATRGMCVSTRYEVIAKVGDISETSKGDQDLFAVILRECGNLWAKRRNQYAIALDRDREWSSCAIYWINSALFYILIVLIPTLQITEIGWGSASKLAFRKTEPSAQATLLNAWLANVAQLLLSFCYLAVNSKCTAMAGAAEWNNLAISRKGLRVTRPVGDQREKYILQLPYRWSIPLAAAGGGMHWLLSQSIFIVRIDKYDRERNIIQEDSLSAIGFSAISFIVLILCFYVLVGSVAWIGRRQMRVRIPFAASCSLVISAACHPPPDDIDPHLRPVQWGVIERTMCDGEKHCSLPSKPVTKPKIGEKYL